MNSANRIDDQHHRRRNTEEPEEHFLHLGYLRDVNRGENVAATLQVPCRTQTPWAGSPQARRARSMAASFASKADQSSASAIGAQSASIWS